MKTIKCPICGKRTGKNRAFKGSEIRQIDVKDHSPFKMKYFVCQHCGGTFGGNTISGKRRSTTFDRN